MPGLCVDYARSVSQSVAHLGVLKNLKDCDPRLTSDKQRVSLVFPTRYRSQHRNNVLPDVKRDERTGYALAAHFHMLDI